MVEPNDIEISEDETCIQREFNEELVAKGKI